MAELSVVPWAASRADQLDLWAAWRAALWATGKFWWEKRWAGAWAAWKADLSVAPSGLWGET